MAETPAPLLELDHVSKRFDRTVVADDLCLSIEKGEFFTFLGPSGSGKSSTLRIIAGLAKPDSGRVLIEGKDVSTVPPWRRNLGMVFQQYAIFPHMTVAENVAYGLRVRGMARGERQRRVEELVDLVGLTGMEKKNVTLLSGGEQQRVAVARALAPRPAILLLDEPLAALDEKIRREMQTELKHLQRGTGTTFLYVTHDQEEALTMSDRIAVLNRGVCVQCDRPEALFRRPRARFVAGFFRGCNVLDARLLALRGAEADIEIAGQAVTIERGEQPERAPGGCEVALRAENILVGAAASNAPVRLDATLEEMIYRGTNVDHHLAFRDGQKAIATSTRRELETAPTEITIGFRREDVILLAD